MTDTEQTDLILEEIELTPLRVKGELIVAEDDVVEEEEPAFLVHYGLLMLTIIIPVMLSALYFFGIAAPRYVSEAHFIVRSSSTSQGGVGGVAAMLENQGLTRANDETYAVNDYLVSRDIVSLLVGHDNLRRVLSRPEADIFSRYPNFYSSDNKENLYRRYKSMVNAAIDSATGISTLQVDAFRAEDAHSTATAILKYAEDLINRLNARAFEDAERYAQSIVDREREHIQDIETRMTDYRNASGTIDPSKEALASFELVGKMTTELVLIQSQLDLRTNMAPADPSLPSMRQQVLSLRNEIDKQKRAIVGNDKSLATKLAGFEKLELERELSARALGMAIVNLAKAREDVRQQHLYLQMIVEPNFADRPDRMRGLIGMFIVLLISIAVYTILRAVGSIMLEHSS